MRLWVLGSGSSGNAVLIETERTRILIDAGFAPRVLKKRLAVAGVARTGPLVASSLNYSLN